ncbi:MFS transporter [Pseudonocardia phyllosphaerae]|uniref:MFS transporter n=1 Tax=Pseudonocardia phyllosphaerae TaxID=3390502 RepID=UPI00397B1826
MRTLRRSPALWLAAYGLTLLGGGMMAAVLPLLVLQRTGDVLAAGVLATVTTTASAMTGLVSGLIVDRFDRRLVTVVAGVLVAAEVAGLAVVDTLWGLDMAAFLVLGTFGAIVRVPAMTAQEVLLPALVRLDPRPGRLDRLVALRENLSNILLLAGPAIGGVAVAVAGPPSVVLLMTASTSLLAACAAVLLDPRAGRVETVDEPTAPAGALRRAGLDLAASWRFLARNRLVLSATLVSAVLVAVIATLQTTVLPAYFVEQDLAALTGLTLSALAAGGVAGSVVYATLLDRVRRRTWFVIGMLGFGTGFALVGSLASPWLVLGAAALVGFTNAPVGAVLGVLTIEATPDALRGRVLGAQNTLLLAAPAVTAAPVAALASSSGLGVAGAVLAAVAAGTALVALVVPAFRDLGEPEPAEPPARPDGVALALSAQSGGAADATRR